MTTYLNDKAAAGAGARPQERRMKTSAETRSQHDRRRERRPTPNVDQVTRCRGLHALWHSQLRVRRRRALAAPPNNRTTQSINR